MEQKVTKQIKQNSKMWIAGMEQGIRLERQRVKETIDRLRYWNPNYDEWVLSFDKLTRELRIE